jgi:hypothetical protein
MATDEVVVESRRRDVLRAAGVGVAGVSGLAASGRATAGGGSASASVTFEEQSTDGSSVVIAHVATDTDAQLSIIDDAAGENELFGGTSLAAGTDETELTVDLSTPIPESQTIRAVLLANDSIVASDEAYVSVGSDGNTQYGTQLVEANPEAGFNYPYFLFVPSESTEFDEVPILVEPNNTGTSTDDFERHRERARETVEGGISRSLSEELGVPLLVPVFPRPRSEPVDWRHYVHQLDTETMAIDSGPLERVDRQLLAMVEDAKQQLGDWGTLHDQIIMNGFSASGNFVNRFAALQPDSVLSVTAGGVNGMAILPLEEAKGHTLNYQIGVADLESLTGEPFDRESFASVNQFIYMGEMDGNDTISYGDAWSDEQREKALDVYGVDMLDERFPYCQTVYDEIGASAAFKVYDRVGHTPRPAADDVAEFHRRSIAGEDVSDFDEDLGSGGGAGAPPTADFEYRPSEPAVGTEITFDASGSTAPSGEPLSYTWDFGDGETAAGAEVSHRYTEAGFYTVELSVVDDSGRTAGADTSLEVESTSGSETTGSAGTTSVRTSEGPETNGEPAGGDDGSGAIPGFGVAGALTSLGAAAHALTSKRGDEEG